MIVLIDCTSWTRRRLCLPIYAAACLCMLLYERLQSGLSCVYLSSWKWTSERPLKLLAWHSHYAQNQECMHPCVCVLTAWDGDVSVTWASLGCCWSWCQTWRQAGRWTRAAHRRQPHGNWLGISARHQRRTNVHILKDHLIQTIYRTACPLPDENPSCLQTVVGRLASSVPSPQTAPHCPLKYTSSLPLEGNSPPSKRTWPE